MKNKTTENGKIKVLKITDPTGRDFYTSETANAGNYLIGGNKLEICEMTPEEYQKIPATQDAIDFFKTGIHAGN